MKKNILDFVKREYKGLKYNYNFTICYGLKDTSLEYAILHPNTKEIAYDAFNSCRGLKEVVLNEGIEKIGNHAFANCYDLKEVNFPSTLKYISEAAFKGASLKAVDLSKCIDLKLSKESFLFNENTTLALPDTLKIIPEWCFAYSNITELNLPDSLETIDKEAFSQCKQLELINLRNVKYLNTSCFAYCFNLKKIEHNNCLEVINNDAFCHSKLEKIDLSKCPIKALRHNTFEDCFNLKEVILPDTLEVIEKSCFAKTNLTTIRLPDSIKKIDENFASNGEYDKMIIVKYNKLPKEVINNIIDSYNLEKEGKSLDELIEEGKSFREMNSILKNQETER